MVKKLHIAIDGPVAAGKGTVASRVAQRLGILYIESGAMYRAVALLGMGEKYDLTNEKELLSLLQKHTLDVKSGENPGSCEVLLDGELITDKIRTPEVSRNSSIVAALPGIRAYLVEKQKAIARDHSVVMEGRDIGTVVLPDANIKVFLTANSKERAKRRQNQLREKGIVVNLDKVFQETQARDHQDITRAVSPLIAAPGAVVIDTTNLTIEQVVDKIISLT